MPVTSHVAAPVSTNSKRLTAKPIREELSVICACTGPVGTGLGAVYVECGRLTRPNKMSTHTNTHKQRKNFKAPYLSSYAIRYEETFFPSKTKEEGSRCTLSAPHYNASIISTFHCRFDINYFRWYTLLGIVSTVIMVVDNVLLLILLLRIQHIADIAVNT